MTIYREILGCRAVFKDVDRGKVAFNELNEKLTPFIDLDSILFDTRPIEWKNKWGWIVRYCPLCIRYDPVPFFRYSWYFTTECRVHHIRLEHACPSCHSLVQYWMNRWDESIRLCYKCKWDLGSELVPLRNRKASDEELLIAIKAGMSNIKIMRILDYWDDERINRLRPVPPKMTRVKYKRRVFSDNDIRVFIEKGRSDSWIKVLTLVEIEHIEIIRETIHSSPENNSEKIIHHLEDNITKTNHTRPIFSISRDNYYYTFNDEEIKTAIRLGRTNSWILNNMCAQYSRTDVLRIGCPSARPIPGKVGRPGQVNKRQNRQQNASQSIRELGILPSGFTDEEIKASIGSGRSNNWICIKMHVQIERVLDLRKRESESKLLSSFPVNF